MDAGRHPLIEVITNAEIISCDGEAGDFQVRVRKHPRYVDESRCVACGECVEHCPVSVSSRDFDSRLRPQKAIYRPFPQSVPAAYLIDRPEIAPCKLACPIGQDVQGYLALAAAGKLAEAHALIRRTSALPGVCSRVCYHPCEAGCRRSAVDEPLAIRAVKRYILEQTPIPDKLLSPAAATGKRLAIVGSGPAGLTAAHDLALRGHSVVILEREREPGGMLRLGIPAYRLPREVLDRDISVILGLGVELRTGEAINPAAFAKLRDEYDAVFLATGAHHAVAPKIPCTAGTTGVWLGIDLLRRVNLGAQIEMGRQVAVVGGGNTAIDAARTALRLGASRVRILYRRSRSEMPADEEEIRALNLEGIGIDFLVAPTRIITERGKLVGVDLQHMALGDPDDSGRRRPVPIPGNESIFPADTVILAIGQKPQTELLHAAGLTLTRWDTVDASELLCRTNLPGVFAGGDVVRGPASVVEAMADGKRAATAIDNYLCDRHPAHGLQPPLHPPEPMSEEERLTMRISTPVVPRVVMPEREVDKRCRSFVEVERGYDARAAEAEAARCLGCGVCSGCRECIAACEAEAIDLDMQAVDLERDVGSILVAVGFKEFEAERLGNYGYGRYPDVITSLELERMLSASGPTQGHVIRPSDRTTPKRIVFVQCAGARGEGGRNYCSRFCCMNAVKDSMLIRSHDPEVEEITILYTDLRAFGKGFDDFLQRSRDEESARYLRGRPAKITANGDGSLQIFVEDTLAHRQERLAADLVVLSIAAAPSQGTIHLAKTLGIATDDYGFIARRDPAISAVETTSPGIYVCGSAVGPQVIPDCVAQASAAAARAELYLAGHRVEREDEPIEPIDLSGPPRIGVMVCHCGANIAGVLDVEALAEEAGSLPDVEVAVSNQFTCSTTGQDELVTLIREHRLNRVVVAACTPRTHEPVFRATCARIGLNPYLVEMVNIRDQCSWVHAGDRAAAQAKARSLLRMGVARTRHLEPLQPGEVPMQRSALVIGGGIAGIQAATDLASQGFPVVLVEKESSLGGRLREPRLKQLYPTLRPAAAVLEEKLARLRESGVRVILGSEVAGITGFVGSFEATITGATEEVLPVGAVILATGADLYKPNGRYRYGDLPNVITSEELEAVFCEGNGNLSIDGQQPKSAAFILCVGSRNAEEGFSGCSRYCCPTAIKQAMELCRQGIDTTIFFRDIRTISAGAEEMYRQARGMGVLFVRIPPGDDPQLLGNGRVNAVRCFDELLGRRLEIPADLVVLSVGMRPRQPETAHFHDLLKLSLGLDGFFLERHPELAPVETAVDGVLLAGTVQGPKDIVDSVAQASAAAAKAAVLLAYDTVRLDPAVSVVDERRCRGCGECVEICEFHAPQLLELIPGTWVSSINPSLCKGCGTCASWCPSGAITSKHSTDHQVHAMIDAFLTAES